MSETLTAIEELEMSEPQSIPETPITADSAPKRGRGRPPGSRNRPKDGSTATNDKPVSPAPRSRGTRGNRANLVREQCSSLDGLGNLALVFLAKDDALDEREMDVLADALSQEAMSSDRIMRWMTTASKVTPHIALASALVAIAVPRLQRRGILPNGIDATGATPTGENANGYATPIEPIAPETEGGAVIDYSHTPFSMAAG